ncbi:hypothetical protein [Clostridium sp. IBUN13A]|uniref:hypothetical protein n=1 Tax=Clostridium sp. IBUN13A TaxID=1523156 RepID=UPI0019100B82|nr:hypothetical protein [Clostridium sp. IBUN13A]
MNKSVFGYLLPPVLSDDAGISLSNLIFATRQINSKATINDSSCDLNNWLSFTRSRNCSSEIPTEE